MSRKKYNADFKKKLIEEHDAGASCYSIGQKYGVDAKCIRSWCRLYKQYGDVYLTEGHANINYTAEFKERVVQSYLAGGKTYQSVAEEFNILAPTTVKQWVMMYNNHEELKNSRKEGIFDMVKDTTRKTEYEERIEIVEHCIANHNNYAATAKEYHVSYGQVYAWVRKYKESGVEGLVDRRGKRKDTETLTDLEKLRVENRMLKAENKQKQMEIDFLKKLEEIEGRWS